MKHLVPLFLFAIVATLLFGIGCSTGVAQPNLRIVAGELKVSGYSFTINPCKYTYQEYGTETAKTSIKNLSSSEAKFSVGNNVLIVPGDSSLEYETQVNLVGQTERIRITKLAENQTGLSIQETLVLKIEPR